MTYLVGIGNALRGEDAFGLDVVKAFEKKANHHCIQTLQLLPEHCLQLQNATKIIFVDASVGQPYTLAVPLPTKENILTHQLSPFILMQMLRSLYKVNVPCFIFSMHTKNFNQITNINKYQHNIELTKKAIALL